MSLEYYLFCKKRYDSIINYLEAIIYENELFFHETSTLEMNIAENILNELSLIDDREVFKSKLKYYTRLRNILDKKIQILCQHNFVDDYIDINPECSQKITYCTICEYTK